MAFALSIPLAYSDFVPLFLTFLLYVVYLFGFSGYWLLMGGDCVPFLC